MPENNSMMDRRTASFSGVPVGRGTLIRSTTSRRSSWEMAARRSLIDSGTGFELGVEATSLMTVTPYHRDNSERNANSSAWKAAGSLMYGAWLPLGMTTFRPLFTERISRSACV